MQTSVILREHINPSPLKIRFRIFTGAVAFVKAAVAPNARSITYGRIAGSQNVNDGVNGAQLVNFATTITWGESRDSTLPLADGLSITGTAAASRFFITWVE